MLFIGVEVEQETSAPPPKRNPGSAPAAGFINLSSLLAVAAFDLVYCSLSVLRFVFVLDISKLVVVKWSSVCLKHVYCKVEVYVQ